LEELSLPNGVVSGYDYDAAGRLTLLTHATLTETLGSYAYGLDGVGNRRVLTETLVAVLDAPGAYLESGQVVAYHEFDPYGAPVQGGGDPYGYTGEWWEDEVELLHLRARWYDPAMGRFLSQDPVETQPPYVYVSDNPTNRIDPSGLFSGDAIENSLRGRSVSKVFEERAGLYHLLLSAEDNGGVNLSIWSAPIRGFLLISGSQARPVHHRHDALLQSGRQRPVPGVRAGRR
jgi:RHS repeat-associated protein